MSRAPLLFATVAAAIVPGLARAAGPADAEPLTWIEIPDSALRPVTPQSPDEFPGTWGVEGPSAVIDDWNGAALDTARGRLLLHGGGHAGYFGNEIYAFDMETLAWSRLTDPSPTTPGSDINEDGTPQSRHTYNGTTYVAHLDSFFVFAGSGSTIGDSGFPPTENVWTYDFGASAWNHVNTPPPAGPPHGEGSSALYDPASGLVWYGEGWNSNPSDGWGLWAWDPDASTWTHHTNESVFSSATGCVDTKRSQLVFVGGGAVTAFDISGEMAVQTTLETTGATAAIDTNAAGVDYDPVMDRVVVWGGGPVYSLDLDTLEWTAIEAEGAPTPNGNNTYHRFMYVPSVNAFVSVNHIDDNVFFFKHGEGGGMPPPSPDDTGGSDDGSVDESGGGTTDAPSADTSGGADTAPPADDDGGDESSGGAAFGEDASGCACRSDASGASPLWLLVLLVSRSCGSRGARGARCTRRRSIPS